MINWLDRDDVLAQVRREFERGDLLVKPKQEDFRKDLKRYYNEKKNSDKVGDTTIYNVHSALLARTYVNSPTISFDTFNSGFDDIVANLNTAFRSDFESQDMEVCKYQQLWDALFYGVGIIAKTGWDGLQKRPTFQVVDPRMAIPDPDGDYSNNDYSYIGFLKKCYIDDLKALGYDTEEITCNSNSSTWPEDIKREDQQAANLAPTSRYEHTGNDNVEVYYHYTTIGQRKYMIVTANFNTLLLDIQELPAVTDAEKKDPTKIQFPFSFKYFKPIRNNFYGYRVIDLVRDVQDVKALIANLRLDKSKAELYPMYLYNTRLVKNKTDLDFWFNKLIAVNPLEGESIQNSIQPLQKDFRADNSYLIDNSLDQQVQSSTSIGRLVEGSTTERRETATTNRIAQGNTDINLSLIEKTMSWGDKYFAELWFRGYLENFLAGDVKKVRFYTGYGMIPKKLRKKDFLINDDIEIYVVTNTERQEKLDKQRVAFAQVFPLLQTLQIPPVSMNYAFRQILEANGLDSQQIEIIVPKTPQELIAETNIELLKMGEFVPMEETYDPMTHLIMLKNVENTVNVEIYRQGLLELYKMQGGGEAMPEVNESVKNNVSAQAMNQLGNASQSAQF
jgi:hypothetical protein